MSDAASPHLLTPVRQVALTQPFGWLSRGWRDFTRTWTAGVLHGLLVCVGAWIIFLITLRYWYLLPGAFSGFLLIGPIVATGLYELSRQLEHGRRPGLRDALAAWRRGTRPLVWLGLILALAGTAWVLVSAVLFALFVSAPINSLRDVLQFIVLSEGSNLFPVWMALGGLGASLVFAVTVVSAPMLLDRDVDMVTAVTASVRAVGHNPFAMVVWATIIMIATGLAMATLGLGFIVAIPVIGNATWHAYRDLVDASALKARD